MKMTADVGAYSRAASIMLVGPDRKQILERRFQHAGCRVTKVPNGEAAFKVASHEPVDTTVLISAGSLINVAEIVFNLRDLNRSMGIIVLLDRRLKSSNRFLRQLFEHPIAGTKILTRRQLQKQLHAAKQPSPPGIF